MDARGCLELISFIFPEKRLIPETYRQIQTYHQFCSEQHAAYTQLSSSIGGTNQSNLHQTGQDIVPSD